MRMVKGVVVLLTGLLVLCLPGLRQDTLAAKTAAQLLKSMQPGESA